MFDREQVARTEDRYTARADERTEAEERIKRGEVLEADSPDRVRARLERKGLPPGMVSAAMRGERVASRAITAPTEHSAVLNALERIIGASDLISARFLTEGAQAARCVCRIEIVEASGLVIGYGTGVMISPRLLLTNNHVLETPELAARSLAEFNFVVGDDDRNLPSVRFALAPDTLFVTDPALDYTVVAVNARSLDGKPLGEYGWVPLIEQQGKVIKGELVNIIQHPNGEPKQLALRENRVVDLLTDFMHYKTDTAPGSSGSPVFNDEWEMVALHHSGVPARDASRNILTVDGSVWSPEMGEHRVKWVANEGARVSRIVKHLREQSLGPSQRRLVYEALAGPANPAMLASFTHLAGHRPVAIPNDPATVEGTVEAMDGTVTWTIPLQVSVRVGTPVQGVAAAEPPVSPADREDSELAAALDALRRGRSQSYYDETADAENRDRYYADLPKRLSRARRFTELSALLRQTHAKQLRYSPRRHVYPWVDLHPNGMLRSIYTNEEYDPEEFIREDLHIERARAALLRERIGDETTIDPAGAREALDLLEAQLPYNCEHVVPQSWFGKAEPMRGDLHHLFACESRCNSFRSNTPYFEFPHFDEAVRRGCGMTEGDRFEPSHGKGAVARATFYFLLRYPGEIDRSGGELDEDRIELLLAWHGQEPPGEYERHRNAAIFASSGNRNPLIDFPEWAGKIDFTAGLG